MADGHFYYFTLEKLKLVFGVDLNFLKNWYELSGYQFYSQKVSKSEVIICATKKYE